MLDSHCNRKNEAEILYRRCLEIEPRHSFALYNIAVLLEELLSSNYTPQSSLYVSTVKTYILTELYGNMYLYRMISY
jgi:hypothetical protein